VQVFYNNNEAGDTTSNILDSLPRVVHSCVLITGQNDQAPQTTGQTILHSVMQVLGNDTEIHSLHNPEGNSSTTSFTVDVD
jgi:hypothetical protein